MPLKSDDFSAARAFDAVDKKNAELELEEPEVASLQKEAKEFLNRIGEDRRGVLPLPLPDKPVKSPSKSSRLRTRFERRLKVWRVAVKLIGTINLLHNGNLQQTRGPVDWACDSVVRSAQQVSVNSLLCESAKFVRSRRGLLLTGDFEADFNEAVKKLVKTATSSNGYSRISRAPPQVPMQASIIAEPPEDHRGIDILEVLPPRDSYYYSEEKHVVDYAGKSRVVLQELYDQYCFIGGDIEEFVAYHQRKDVQHMWEWRSFDSVKCFGGVFDNIKEMR